VVQELANAKEAEIIIGSHRIPWVAIERVLIKLRKYRVSDYIPNTSGYRRAIQVGELRTMRRTGELISEAELPAILDKLRDLKSTIPNDKLYGLLGIMNRAISVDVDYSKSAEEVFTELAKRYIQQGSTEILYYCGQPHQPTSLDLPSWVPDWTRPRWTTPFMVQGLPAHAAGCTNLHISIDSGSSTIRVQGRLLDRVERIVDCVEFPLTRFDPYDLTAWDSSHDLREKTSLRLKASQRKQREGFQQAVRLAWPSPDHFTWEKYENMWRTFMCNRFAEGGVPTEDYGMAWEFYMLWLTWQTADDGEEEYDCYLNEVVPNDVLGAMERLLFLADWEESQADLLKVGDAQKRWCYHRRFFISQAERYGWAADGSQPGDYVAILYGCDYPFLLRESSDGTYKIVGDCYIHGLMDGEALGDGFEEMEFIIS
jgi:hypothetical protein